MRLSESFAAADDALPQAGNTQRMVAQWSAKIAEQKAQEAALRLPAIRPKRPALPTPATDGRPCLCSCHDRDMLMPARAISPDARPAPAHAQARMAGKSPGAAYALLSKIPRPRRLMRLPIPRLVADTDSFGTERFGRPPRTPPFEMVAPRSAPSPASGNPLP